jgi:hypothetical protein
MSIATEGRLNNTVNALAGQDKDVELVILTKRKYEAKRTIGGLVAGNWCLLGTAHWNGSRDIFTTAISASPHGRRVHVTK